MEIVGKSMNIEGKDAYISKYEVMEAFFRTEEEENVNMAKELNKMINIFCDSERKNRRNVILLPFDIETYKHAIDYIGQVSVR